MEEAKGRSAASAALVAGVAIALLAMCESAAAAEPRPSVLKIRVVGSTNPAPVARAAQPARSTKLTALADAPQLSPTPAPPMFEEEFDPQDQAVEQVAYEDYELTAQEEAIERAAPLLNGNGASEGKNCTIKNVRGIHQLTDAVQATAGRFPEECATPHSGPFEPRSWDETTFMWKASGLCHKPLYFEDVQLERYGHSWGPIAQPVISGGMFFATVPILPYKMGVEAPWECIYPLGYYRPGNCAPYMVPPIPVSVRGAATQAAAVVGGVLLIP